MRVLRDKAALLAQPALPRTITEFPVVPIHEACLPRRESNNQYPMMHMQIPMTPIGPLVQAEHEEGGAALDIPERATFRRRVPAQNHPRNHMLPELVVARYHLS